MKDILNIGVIGTGFIADHNVRALIRTGQARIAAVSSRTLAGAEAFVRKHSLSCPAFDDYRSMCGACRLDAVIIQSPHDLHREQFLFCAERGLDVIIEKPLATSYAGCCDMVRAAKEHGIRAAVCHSQRYGGALIAAREFLDTHETGSLLHAEDLIHTNYFWAGRAPWMLSRERGGGVVLNYAVHQIDRVQYLVGERTRTVFGRIEARKPGIEVDSSYHMMGLTDTASYSLICAGYANPNINRISLYFTKGVLLISLSDNDAGRFGVYWGDTEHDLSPVTDRYAAAEDYYLRQMQPIAAFLRGQDSAQVITTEYAAHIIKAAEGLMESNATRQAVQI